MENKENYNFAWLNLKLLCLLHWWLSSFPKLKSTVESQFLCMQITSRERRKLINAITLTDIFPYFLLTYAKFTCKRTSLFSLVYCFDVNNKFTSLPFYSLGGIFSVLSQMSRMKRFTIKISLVIHFWLQNSLGY